MTNSRGVNIRVKAVPGASADEIVGWLGDMLKIRVQAQPGKGKANAAITSLLAKTLAVPASRVIVLSGKASSRKTVLIKGVSSDKVQGLLPGP